MPRLNGLQVVEGVRTFIRKTNEREKDFNLQVQEPRFVFLTAFLTTAFRQHIVKMNIKEAFEKPIQIETLREILGLVRHEDSD